MAVQIKHFGKIVNGKRVYSNLSLHHQQLLQLEGKEFEEVIKERTKKVTLDQFGFYYGGILPTCHQSEMFSHYDKSEDIHEDYFADKFLSYKKLITLPDGTIHTKTKYHSLTSLNRKEMSEFIEKVLIDCEMNGILVLSPEQYLNKTYGL